MATKVNTKFVIGLSVVLVLLFGVVATFAYQHYAGRAERFVARGDAMLAQGDVADAAKLYERAVGYNRTRLDWLIKWRDALVQVVPEELEYRKQYDFYRNLLRQIALLRPNDFERQREYLVELERFVRIGGLSRRGLESLIQEVEDRSKKFESGGTEQALLDRYRGLALVSIMESTTLDQIQRTQAQDDLTAALASDPTDWESSLGLVRWRVAEAERYRRAGDDRQSQTELEAAQVELSRHMSAFPDNPEGILADLTIDRITRARALVDPEERLRARDELRARAGEVLERMLSVEPSALRNDHISRLTIEVIGLAGTGLTNELIAVVDRALDGRPGDAQLMLLRGQLLQDIGDAEGAFAQFQNVVDLPLPPTSLEGLLLPGQQVTAIARQVDTALIRWTNTGLSAEERQQALDQAQQYRDMLEREIDASSTHMLLLRDAKLALAREEYNQAMRYLSDLHARPEGQTPDVNRLLVQTLELQNNLGEALRVAQELVMQQPTSTWVHQKLGDLHRRLGQFEAALASYQRCLDLDPGNQTVGERISSLRTALGTIPAEGSGDEVIAAVMESRRLRGEQDWSGATEAINAVIGRHQGDRRLLRELIHIAIGTGNNQRAIEIARGICEDNPADVEMCRTAVLLENEDPDDPTTAQLAMIEQQEGLSEVDKLLERYLVFVRHQQDEKAVQELARAANLEPSHPRVIDHQFIRALGLGEFDRARELMQRAAELNLDQVGGLKYQGRLQLFQGDGAAAVQSLEAAADLLPFDPDTHRLLGQAYRIVGRIGDALDHLERAYDGRPDNPANALEYAQTLMAVNRGREALAVVSPETGALRFRADDAALLELWLRLEAQYGDMNLALRMRRDLQQRGTGSIENSVSLANLLMQSGEWEEASQTIDSIESMDGASADMVVMLRAEWHAQKGEVDAGRDLIREHIGTKGDEVSTGDYLALGNFLLRHRKGEEGLAALRKARDYQDGAQMEADRRLGDFFFDQAAFSLRAAQSAEARGEIDTATEYKDARQEHLESAASHYEAVLASSDDDTVRRRAAETLLQLDRLDDAEVLIAAVAAHTPDHKEVLGLKASLAERRGNRRLARQHLDRAIELYPTDPLLFMQRAVFNKVEPSMREDAIEDLEQAVRLRPALTAAWIEAYDTYRSMGDLDEAFATLRRGVAANPDDDRLRIVLLSQLNAAGRMDELQAEALRIVQAHPEDERWLVLVGGAMLRFERWTQATELLGMLFDRRPEPAVAERLLDAMLRPGVIIPRQRIAEVLKVHEQVPATLLEHHLLRARAYTALEELGTAKGHLLDALEMIGNDGEAGRFFGEQLRLAMGGGVLDAMEFLTEVKDSDQLQNMFLRVAEIKGRFESGADLEELIEDAKELELDADEAKADDLTYIELHRLIAQMSFASEQFEQAAEYYRKAEYRAPEDLQINNDLAYLLLDKLDDAESALPYAMKAAALAQHLSPVIDTLGWCYYQLDRLEEAESELERAAEMAANPLEAIPAYIHLGMAQHGRGKMEAARSSLKEAERFCTISPQICSNFNSDLEDLRAACQ